MSSCAGVRIAAGLAILSLAVPLCAQERPPGQALDLDLGGAGWSLLKDAGRDVDRQKPFYEAVSFIERRSIGEGPWFWGWGAKQEAFSFAHRGGFSIVHLQDYAAQFSLEYFSKAEPVASLIIRPGFYFENAAALSSWDIPFDFVTGIPIKDTINGVIGISHGRFYRHPIPVAGFSWIMSPRMKLDAVFPEPSLTVILREGFQARVGGELIGAGFRSDSLPGHPEVEYLAYRIGGNLAWTWRPGVKLSAGAGYEAQRLFNVLTERRKLSSSGAPFLHLGLEMSH